MNKIILTGNLTRDPELRQTTAGVNVADIGLAVTRNAKTADFFDLVAWRETAEYIAKYGRKGSRILIEGQAHNNTWTDKEGNKRTTIQITILHCEFINNRKASADTAESESNGEDDSAADNTFGCIEEEPA